jgi:hypothetical protein
MDDLNLTEALGRQESLLPFHSLAEKVELGSDLFLFASRSRRCLHQIFAKVVRLFIRLLALERSLFICENFLDLLLTDCQHRLPLYGPS